MAKRGRASWNTNKVFRNVQPASLLITFMVGYTGRNLPEKILEAGYEAKISGSQVKLGVVDGNIRKFEKMVKALNARARQIGVKYRFNLLPKSVKEEAGPDDRKWIYALANIV